jgi:antitoxin (DNA-binding transcriptional repressor) of toxin-antitoxin stability system
VGRTSRSARVLQDPLALVSRHPEVVPACNNIAVRKASVSDLPARTSAIVGETSQGSAVTIEKHAIPVAGMRPIKRVAPREAALKLKTLWDSLPQVQADSGKFLEEYR